MSTKKAEGKIRKNKNHRGTKITSHLYKDNKSIKKVIKANRTRAEVSSEVCAQKNHVTLVRRSNRKGRSRTT